MTLCGKVLVDGVRRFPLPLRSRSRSDHHHHHQPTHHNLILRDVSESLLVVITARHADRDGQLGGRQRLRGCSDLPGEHTTAK